MVILPAMAAVVVVSCVSAGPSAAPALPAQALVTDDDVRVRSAPSIANSRIVGIVHRNQLVTAVEQKPGWFLVNCEETKGWMASRFLSFTIPTPLPDPLDAPGDMEWFFARFGGGTTYQVTQYTEKSMSIAEYRQLIRAAEYGDQPAQWILRNSLFTFLAARPDDPRYAMFKRRLHSEEFVFAVLRACQWDPWIVDALPQGWWTAERLLTMTCSVSGQCARQVATRIVEGNPRILPFLSTAQWMLVVSAAKGSDPAGAVVLLRTGFYSAVAKGEIAPSLRPLRDELLSDDFVFRLLEMQDWEWVIGVLPAGWWSMERIMALIDRAPSMADSWKSPHRNVVQMVLAREKPREKLLGADDYRALLKRLKCGAPRSSLSFSLLCGTILPHLRDNPADPRYAALKPELYSKTLWLSFLRCGSQFHRVLAFLPPDWLSRDEALMLMREPKVDTGDLYAALPDAFRTDRAFVLAVLDIDRSPPPALVTAFAGDREIVLRAVGKRGDLLAQASDALRNDREVVRAAVENNECAARFASEALQADDEFREQVKRCTEEP